MLFSASEQTHFPTLFHLAGVFISSRQLAHTRREAAAISFLTCSLPEQFVFYE